MRRLVIAALLLAACGGDDDGAPPYQEPTPDAMPEPPPDTLTWFVIDLIETRTADDTDAVPFDAFGDLDDPDADRPGAYDALFR